MAVTRLVKLRLDRRTRRRLAAWQPQLEAVWNWTLRTVVRERVWYRLAAPHVARRSAAAAWQRDAVAALATGAPLPALPAPGARHPTLDAWLQTRLFALLNGHAARCDVPTAVLRQTVQAALRAVLVAEATGRATGTARRVHRKGARRPLTWLGADSVRVDLAAGVLAFPGLGLSAADARARGRRTPHVRFFRHSRWPSGRVAGTVRLLWRPRGWYAALVFPDAAPALPPLAPEAVPRLGADLGFRAVVTLSDGRRFGRAAAEERLWRQGPKAARREAPHPHHQATRTGRRQRVRDQQRRRTGRVARLQQRLVTARQWRNRAVVRAIQSSTEHLVLLADRLPALQRAFGRSILRNALGDLTHRLQQGSPTGSAVRRWEVTLVPSAYSTTSCPACGGLHGPTGFGQLAIRQWTCPTCHAAHDRDVAAAMNAVVWTRDPARHQQVLAQARARRRPGAVPLPGPRRPSTATAGPHAPPPCGSSPTASP